MSPPMINNVPAIIKPSANILSEFNMIFIYLLIVKIGPPRPIPVNTLKSLVVQSV